MNHMETLLESDDTRWNLTETGQDENRQDSDETYWNWMETG